MGPSLADLRGSMHCPFCGAEVPAGPQPSGVDLPCPRCGRPLWFLRNVTEDGTILAFLPGPTTRSESIERLGELVAAIGGASPLFVDMSHLRFVSSSFLAMLVGLRRKVFSTKGRMRIVGLCPATADAFRRTHLDRLFELADEGHGENRRR